MNKHIFIISIILLTAGCSSKPGYDNSYVEVSHVDPHYFCTSDGKTYIPVGCNLAAMSRREDIPHYLEELSLRGGNFARVWLNTNLFEVETEYGKVNDDKLENIRILMENAHKYGIKIKFCIESFRHIYPGRNRWDTKASYHVSNGGPFQSVEEYITSEEGREEFLRRLQLIKDVVGDDPAVFGWELWNEMNAVDYPDIEEWNVDMLARVKQMFPHHMVMQSLGSLDRMSSFGIYEFINRLDGDEVMQVHRYLDPGAELDICHAPMDSLCEDAVKVLLSYGEDKPALLAEGGAVNANHSGPSSLYPLDKDGILLHDVIFAPFFSGAAGTGHSWHWDHYIEKYGHWDVFRGFSRCVEGIDPAEEHFTPAKVCRNSLKYYCLRGSETTMVWVRDALNNWENEFVQGCGPRTITGERIPVELLTGTGRSAKVSIYDPWKDEWTKLGRTDIVCLPEFNRSIVIKLH